MGSKIGQLVVQMDSLADETWRKVAYGPRRNVRFREDAITGHNLFELEQRHEWLQVWAYTAKERRRPA
ncbi:hypothetical protein [Kribbella kalugense]|uniref:Uncharacterized protein n=1 Tax=Kribbella kalugense TaxID=2512221 RepID=A0A4R7ZD68_9ACTN|nr:hypothetical protein [Kribbella kalugense]TDW15513.1 hypothetical protein EV650_6998 [Kribbella kalugense]